jgi:hypothetical protein
MLLKVVKVGEVPLATHSRTRSNPSVKRTAPGVPGSAAYLKR